MMTHPVIGHGDSCECPRCHELPRTRGAVHVTIDSLHEVLDAAKETVKAAANDNLVSLRRRCKDLEHQRDALSMRVKIAESQWYAVVKEASDLIAKDFPPMAYKPGQDSMYVQIEVYNERTLQFHRILGVGKVMTEQIKVAHREIEYLHVRLAAATKELTELRAVTKP